MKKLTKRMMVVIVVILVSLGISLNVVMERNLHKEVSKNQVLTTQMKNIKANETDQIILTCNQVNSDNGKTLDELIYQVKQGNNVLATETLNFDNNTVSFDVTNDKKENFTNKKMNDFKAPLDAVNYINNYYASLVVQNQITTEKKTTYSKPVEKLNQKDFHKDTHKKQEILNQKDNQKDNYKQQEVYKEIHKKHHKRHYKKHHKESVRMKVIQNNSHNGEELDGLTYKIIKSNKVVATENINFINGTYSFHYGNTNYTKQLNENCDPSSYANLINQVYNSLK